MEDIRAQVDRLSELSDDEISEFESTIIDQFDTFAGAERTAESVDAMTELANLLESVRNESVRRKTEADEREQRVTELSARVHGTPEDESVVEESVEEAPVVDEEVEEPVVASADNEDAVDETAPAAEEVSVEQTPDPEPVVEETPAEVEAPAPAEAPAEGEFASADETEATPAEAEASVVETETLVEQDSAQEEAQTVTASADESFEAPADRRPAAQVTESRTAIVAGADIPGVPAGASVSDMKGVAKLFSDRLRTLGRSGGDGTQTVVASLVDEYDEAHTLDKDADRNAEKVQLARTGLVASGGWIAPVPQSYELFEFDHTTNRPIKGLLPRFAANRGGISYIEPPVLGDYATSPYGAASGIWTADDDEAAANNSGVVGDVTKNVMVVQGAQLRNAELYAVTLQLQIGNLLARAYPELVARHNELALVQHARLAEKTLLSKIDAGSTQVTQAQVLGVARDFIVTVRRAAVAYRSRHRLATNSPLEAIIPDWVYDAMASDLAMQVPGDNKLGVGRAEIEGYLRDAGVRLIGTPDLQEFTAQGAGALAPWASSFEWYLFSPGTWTFLDGGQLDLGIIRDSALVATNDYRMFVESFEGIAKMGIESLAITSTIAVNGKSSAPVVVA